MKIILFLILGAVVINASDMNFKIESFTLKNGLRVYVNENHNSPTVAISLYYDVGSADEIKGKTGFAHLFEHMMFEGSKNLDKGEHFKYINKVGGTMNAFTTKEYTAYFELVPSHQLDLILWLEAERMKNLTVDKVNFENQLEVVKEEMRASYTNRPYGEITLAMADISHDNYNYQHSTIGSIEDLNSSNVEYAKEFFDKYYNPNNCILTIVGDLDSKTIKEKVEKYFLNIENKSAKKEKLKLIKIEKKENERTIEDRLAKLPAIGISFKAPNFTNDDFYVGLTLETILFNDESSRLYRLLVKEKELALSIYGGQGDYKNDNLFYIYSIVKKSKEEEVLKEILAEIEKMKKEDVSDEELKKAKTRLKTDYIFKMQSNLSKSLNIGKNVLLLNDENAINTFLTKINKITKEDIKNYVKKYMDLKNKKVLRLKTK